MPTILVADDFTDDRLHMVALLKKAGHAVIEAHNGREAVELARRHRPDGVILDIVMPTMDGFTAADRIAKNPVTKHIPVALVCTKIQESDRFRAVQVGAKSYQAKPLDLNGLLTSVGLA